MSKVTTSDWNAWINKMPGSNNDIHVIGIVDAHSKELAFLKPKIPQGINKDILLLDLRVVSGFVPVDNPQKVHYTEELPSGKSYTAVEIYLGNQFEVRITEIGIVQ